jgi:DNA-binding phage protein
MLHPYNKIAKQHQAINRVLTGLDERNRRRFIGVLALQWGRGGISQLAQVTGLSRNTIDRGRQEVAGPGENLASGIRSPGAGRRLVEKNSPAC